MKNRATLLAVLLLATAAALTACDDGNSRADSKPNKAPTAPSKAVSTAAATPSVDALAKATGIPPKPTGAARARLLRALAAAAPAASRYEDKAVDAARNQCSAINAGAQRLDHLASQRFTYKDVTTTEAQGKQINQALKATGFCVV
ncbi:hypothetical protein OHB41_46135 [Streptomyces sp. NBC_01571]|uniref:hypothetical protein n=1 Tax=Streptomyces sp. NBC_01571 TaxID=2975883 RepID=UPI002259E191|nr:hypothetical protein [Streptomyces sp. NBC_01571]MCX4580414.1 hypothetical protein [Streptomyces sp. NBC_01571]